MCGGGDLTIEEATQIGAGVTDGLASDANVIFGAKLIPEMRDQIRVMSIVTGVKAKFGERQEDHGGIAALRMENMERSSEADLTLCAPPRAAYIRPGAKRQRLPKVF